ncbi:acyltransferase [Streptococcus halichoeri]|uniref:acyltransferase n=1 Tax=Streptococcus halichoeri TaxID=254785 RepID=UPI00135CBE89|nr:acyltransferase family protein [Streptococcus halichoeri]
MKNYLSEQKSQRNTGLDLLRIISMFMIVITHVLGKGGLRSSVQGQTDAYFIVTWMIQVLVYGAVNCYALISGYVGVHSTYRYSKLLAIWTQVFFYTFSITSLFALFGYPVSLMDWRNAFLPIVSGQYWYITAYFGLLIFMPLITNGIQSLTNRQLYHLVILMFGVFSLLPALMNNRVSEFSLSKGFEMTWLMILYILGAYLRRLDLSLFKNSYLLSIYLLSLVATYIMKFLVGNIWYWYVSPTLTLGAICFFILFAKVQITPGTWFHKMIVVLAPTTLGVYLCHLHPLVVRYFVRDFAASFVQESIFFYPLLILGAAIAIYLLAFTVERLRLYIFKQVHFRQFLAWFDRKFPYND